jgi:hypothetical protein
MDWGLKVGLAWAGIEERAMRVRRRGRGMWEDAMGRMRVKRRQGSPRFRRSCQILL